MSLEVLTLEELWRIGNCRVVYDVRFNGNTKFVTLESVKSRDAQRLKWVTEKEKELTLLNYPYGSHSSELKLIREVKSLLLVEKEAKTL